MDQNNLALLKARISAYLNSEEFCTALFKTETAAQFVQLLSEYGIEATEEEVAAIANEGSLALARMKDTPNVELSEDELDDVAGGGTWRRIARGTASVLGGAALGFAMGLVCGACPAFTPAAYKIAVGYGVASGVWIAKG